VGESVDPADLDYDLEAWHLGAVAVGIGVGRAVRGVAGALGCRLLCVEGPRGAVWAWLGAPRKLASADIERLWRSNAPDQGSLTVGEPARGIAGWRQTHLEARAALPVALRSAQPFTRCTDVLLEAAVLRDETLARSLVRSYLAPLEDLRIGGQKARETLRVYFSSARNVSAAAQLLGVARNTVESRLRDVEWRLGRPLSTCLTELEVALRLESLPGPIARSGDYHFPQDA
jgi:DNA-binding PucR family transcriptional regulator